MHAIKTIHVCLKFNVIEWPPFYVFQTLYDLCAKLLSVDLIADNMWFKVRCKYMK